MQVEQQMQSLQAALEAGTASAAALQAANAALVAEHTAAGALVMTGHKQRLHVLLCGGRLGGWCMHKKSSCMYEDGGLQALMLSGAAVLCCSGRGWCCQ